MEDGGMAVTQVYRQRRGKVDWRALEQALKVRGPQPITGDDERSIDR